MLGGLNASELATTGRTVSELSSRVTELMDRVRAADDSGAERTTVASARQLVTGLSDDLQVLAVDAAAPAATMASWNASVRSLDNRISAASKRLDALIGKALFSRPVTIGLWVAGGLVAISGLAWFAWWARKRWG